MNSYSNLDAQHTCDRYNEYQQGYLDDTPIDVKPSPIHGLGGFSARAIKQGEVFAGNNIPDFRGYNHSDFPNFQLRRIDGKHREIALRDLVEGEEITVDYYDVGNEAFWKP